MIHNYFLYTSEVSRYMKKQRDEALGKSAVSTPISSPGGGHMVKAKKKTAF